MSINLRSKINGDLGAGRFSTHLLQLGNGNIRVDEHGEISIPEGCGEAVKTVEELKLKVYSNIQHNFKDSSWPCDRAILAPKNESVTVINWKIMQEILGNSVKYSPVDKVIDEE